MTEFATLTSPSLLSSNNNISHLSSDFRTSLDGYLQYEKGMSLLNGRYSFQSHLQTGSFGKVTAAIDVQINKLVAVKALKKSIQGVRSMANHEVAIMKHLGYHPNICQLLDAFETKKYIILVLEYVACGDLYDAVHNKTPLGLDLQTNAKMFASLCKQLLDVVNYTHSKGVFHRDIKPENILLMRDGTIKLCDWGLATRSVKCNDFNVGTEKYMAPEALDDSKGEFYDATKVDTWSVGITLLYTLFNKCPFRKALASDTNYSSFINNKNFLFDFYHTISTASFTGIIDKLLIERDLNGGLSFLMTTGLNRGFNIDQEYMISFTEQENRYINYVNNQVVSSSNNNNEDLFMFDDEDLQEFKFEQQQQQQQQPVSQSYAAQLQQAPYQSIADYMQNCNVDPISIPVSDTKLVNESKSYSSYKNTNSLFDKNALNSIQTATPSYVNYQSSYVNTVDIFGKGNDFFS